MTGPVEATVDRSIVFVFSWGRLWHPCSKPAWRRNKPTCEHLDLALMILAKLQERPGQCELDYIGGSSLPEILAAFGPNQVPGDGDAGILGICGPLCPDQAESKRARLAKYRPIHLVSVDTESRTLSST